MVQNNTGCVTRKKIDSLQTVRALAFLGIFASHCGIGTFAAWGVSVFIILSGFLMVYSYYGKDIDCSLRNNLKFSIGKISKLYKMHIIMTFVALISVIISVVKDYSLFRICKQGFLLILNLLLVQAWLPDERIYFSMNGVSWYLSLCLFLYFAFPFVLKKVNRIKNIKQACIIAALLYLAQCAIGLTLYFIKADLSYLESFSKWLIYICPLFRLADFTIGCCLGYIFLNKKSNIKCGIASACEILIFASIFLAQYIYDHKAGFFASKSFKYNMLFTISSAALVYLFSLNRGVISKALTCKPLVYFGNISSYAFLIHVITIQYTNICLTKVWNIEDNKYVTFIVALAATVVLTEIYILMEKLIISRSVVKRC